MLHDIVLPSYIICFIFSIAKRISKMKKYFYGIAAMILAIILLMTGCSHKPASYQCADTAMGTIISQTI